MTEQALSARQIAVLRYLAANPQETISAVALAFDVPAGEIRNWLMGSYKRLGVVGLEAALSKAKALAFLDE